MKKLKRFQRVEIFWVDSLHTSGWKWIDDTDLSDTDLYHQTTGYFLQETPKAITVCQSFKGKKSKDGDSCVDAIMTIPKAAIQKLKTY